MLYHFSTRRNYHCQPNILFKNNMRHLQGWRSRSDHPTLVRPKMLSFTVKALYFQSSGMTSNYQIEVLFKWSEQFCTPSDPPPLSYAGINFINNHLPVHPRDLYQKFAPTQGPLNPSFAQGGGEICWDSSRGAGICL